MKTKHYIAAAAVSLAAVPAQSSTLTDLFDSFYVVGDSLSDNGNTAALVGAIAAQQTDPVAFPPPQPFQQPGVSSDGFTWAKEFTDAFEDAGKVAANLSFGAARARDDMDGPPDLALQLDPGVQVTTSFTFKDASSTEVTISGTAPKYADGGGGLLNRIGDGSGRELVTFFVGGNDFRDLFDETDAAKQAQIFASAAAAIQTSMFTALSQGVQDFVLMSIPDFTTLPGLNLLPETDPTRIALKQTITQFNDLLYGTDITPGLADALRSNGAIVTEVDIFALLNDDEKLGFFGPDFDTTNACVDVAKVSNLASCDGFLFWDRIHPTSQGHQLIAMATQEALSETYGLQPIPLPAPALLLLGALGGLGLLRRRTAG